MPVHVVMATAPVEYPSLKQISPPSYDFRNNEVLSIKSFIENEVNKHLRLYKKLKRAVAVLQWIRYVFINLTVAFNAATLGSLLAFIPAAYALYFEISSLLFGVCMNLLSLLESRLGKKLEKHDENHTLAVSALMTITELLSTALDDGSITESEFKVILNERRKYLEMRRAVRSKHFHEADAQEIKKSVEAVVHR